MIVYRKYLSRSSWYSCCVLASVVVLKFPFILHGINCLHMSFSDVTTSVEEPNFHFNTSTFDISVEEAKGILQRVGLRNTRILSTQRASPLSDSMKLMKYSQTI